jgi:hypothetical protein
LLFYIQKALLMSSARRILKKAAPAWIAGAALLGVAPLAHGQPLACAAETVGELSVQAGVRCQCVRVAGGSITGAPSGYAWDCGILRGRLNQLVSPAPDAYQGLLPEGIIVETENGPEPPRRPWIDPRPPSINAPPSINSRP